jgi:hypothetical protein
MLVTSLYEDLHDGDLIWVVMHHPKNRRKIGSSQSLNVGECVSWIIYFFQNRPRKKRRKPTKTPR